MLSCSRESVEVRVLVVSCHRESVEVRLLMLSCHRESVEVRLLMLNCQIRLRAHFLSSLSLLVSIESEIFPF